MDEIIRKAIERVAKGLVIKTVLVGTAKNVTDTQCDVEIEGAPTKTDVVLNAIEGTLDSYVTIVPKEGSTVLIAVIENRKTDAVVISCSLVEKVIMKCGDSSFEFKPSEIVFNSGNNGGLPITSKVVERLNKIEDDVNSLKQVFQGWSPVSQDGGAALKAASASWAGQALSGTIDSHIENEKVKH